MAHDSTAIPLQQFIASLDKSCLPRIVQVSSGVYFQGSVYEISGSDVCLSTGDLVKIVDLDLISVCCEDISSRETFELPIHHTGLFQVAPEQRPYSSVEELLQLRPLGLHSGLPFTFCSLHELPLDGLTLAPGMALTPLSLEQGGAVLRCSLQGAQGVAAEVLVPVSARGDFYEQPSPESFTLQEIMATPAMRCCRFLFSNTTMAGRTLLLAPVFQVHAIMHLRKDMVKFSSNLEVEVVDVTEQSGDVTFITPLSLTQVFSLSNNSFPCMAEVLEAPQGARALFRCPWLGDLSQGSRLVLWGRASSPLVLACSPPSRSTRGRQYFLLSQRYGGRLRRAARGFSSVYELHMASLRGALSVSVSAPCEQLEEDGVPALSLGDQLEVLHYQEDPLDCGGPLQALVCRRLHEDEEDEEDEEEDEGKDERDSDKVLLPLYMQAQFVEKVSDKRKYRLKELGKEMSLPLQVKVVSRDASMEADPLVGFPYLTLEEALLEPTIQASLPARPELCFEVPVHWMSMSVCLTQEPLPWAPHAPPKSYVLPVTEVTETFLYELRKRTDVSEPPPPRPPKRCSSKAEASAPPRNSSKPKAAMAKDLLAVPAGTQGLTTALVRKLSVSAPLSPTESQDTPPPIIPRKPAAECRPQKAMPNHYVMTKVNKHDSDSDHDYEVIDETLDIVKTAHENLMFY